MTTAAAAHTVATMLCARIAAAPVPLPDGGALTVGISVGSAAGDRDAGALLAAADAALYAAGAAGRGRATAAEPGEDRAVLAPPALAFG